MHLLNRSIYVLQRQETRRYVRPTQGNYTCRLQRIWNFESRYHGGKQNNYETYNGTYHGRPEPYNRNSVLSGIISETLTNKTKHRLQPVEIHY
jgi:hypothetical protein